MHPVANGRVDESGGSVCPTSVALVHVAEHVEFRPDALADAGEQFHAADDSIAAGKTVADAERGSVSHQDVDAGGGGGACPMMPVLPILKGFCSLSD